LQAGVIVRANAWCWRNPVTKVDFCSWHICDMDCQRPHVGSWGQRRPRLRRICRPTCVGRGPHGL